MTASRFDQKDDQPYGSCETCELELGTEVLAKEHMNATFEEARDNGRRASHRVLISNPSRASRIGNEVDSLVQEAITTATEELDELVEKGDITRAEATTAIARWSDFADEWSNDGLDDDDDTGSAEPSMTAATENTAITTP